MSKNFVDLVINVENRLGWLPDTSKHPRFKARAIEAGMVKKKMEKQTWVTMADLDLALEYVWRKRISISRPVALFSFVKAAKEEANAPAPELSDLSASAEAALEWEMTQLEPDFGWITRFTQSRGPARGDVLREWKAAGRG